MPERPRSYGLTYVATDFQPVGPLAANLENTPSYYSYNPHYYAGEWSNTAGAQRGALSGWSGETSYNHNDSGSETMTASYPSGVADPCRSDRNLCPDTADADDPDALFRYIKTMGADLPDNARHMGVFIDLPAPEEGYVDQRETLAGLMGYEQMTASGLEYDSDAQTIANDKGLATTASGSDFQSPIYQSLFSALAYYTAYKETDEFNTCGRSNHILLFYDGKEDGRWSTVDGNRVFSKPEEMAARLYDELDVKVHVVILSNNYGDISQANAIASAGGTEEALVVSNLDALRDALSAVFSVVRSSISYAAPAIPAISKVGDYAYEVSDNFQPDFGQLTAYQLGAHGAVDTSSPAWRADDGINQTVALRKARLLSTNAAGDIVNFYSDIADAAFVAGSSPDADTIREYTMNPNYDDGSYLADRSSSALIGKIGATSPVLVSKPRNSALFSDPDYRTFMSNNAARKPLVIFTSQDGFLYAVDAATGELKWGWMPRPFVDNLKDFNQFTSQKHFQGDFQIVDAKDTNGDYHSYIVGTGERGNYRYVLRLDTDDDDNIILSTDSIVWEEAYTFFDSPNSAENVIWRGEAGDAFAVYVWRLGPSISLLVVRDITTNSLQYLVYTNVDPATSVTTYPYITSTPRVVKEKDGETYIYVGDSTGEIYRANWAGYGSGVPGTLVLENNFETGSELGSSELITYIGYSTYKDSEYLRVQSLSRFTVLKRASSGDDWAKSWSAYESGADNYSASPSSTSKIQHLAANAEITAEALIVLGGVLLPVYEQGAGENSCSIGAGYYYLYNLDGGLFPNNKFTFEDAILVDSDTGTAEQTGANNPKILLGTGRVHKPAFSVFEGEMAIFSHTEDSSYKVVKVNNAPIGTRNWREIHQ